MNTAADVLANLGDWSLECGDGVALASALSGVAAVLTDPPYGMANKTNSKRFSGGNRALRPVKGRDDWPEVVNDAVPFDPAPWLRFPKVIMWGANHYAARLPLGTTLVWIKKADHLFGTFLSDAEIGWMKGGHGVYCFRKQNPPSVRIVEGNGKVLHPNQKPLDLMVWCLERLKLPRGSVVLDPYAGSATTGIACLSLGLRFIGYEVSPGYYAVGLNRLREATGQTGLFTPEGSHEHRS